MDSMSLFPSSPLLREKYNGIPIPLDILSQIKEKKFQEAINQIVNKPYPFNLVYRWLSNHPEALQVYLYKIASSIDTTPGQLNVVAHLYIDVALINASFAAAFEKKDLFEKLQKFITSYKSAISYKVILRSVMRSGIPSLVAFVASTFQDYETALYYQSEMKDYPSVLQSLKNLSPNKQRQMIKYLSKTYSLQLLEFIDSVSEIDSDAYFDAMFELFSFLSEPEVAKKSSTLINQSFNIFDHFQGSTIHATIQLLFVINQNDEQRLNDFFKSNSFKNVQYDIIVLYLVERGKYDIAAEIYGRVPNHRIQAISFAFKDSKEPIKSALKLLTKVFPNPEATEENEDLQKEIRGCWLHLFQLAQEMTPKATDQEIKDIFRQASLCVCLTVNDLMLSVPKGSEISDLIPKISKSFKKSAEQIQKAKELNCQIDKISEKQRKIKNDPPSKVPEKIKTDMTCFLCGLKASDSQFISFKCGHAFHVSCFENEPHYHYDHKITDPNEMARSCPQCGTFAIEALDVPFVDPRKDSRELTLWTI